MITGTHAMIYSRNAEADRAFLRKVIGLPGIDVGGGWMIFAMPPAELGVHPSDENNVHELYLMCDDVNAFVTQMSRKGATCGPIEAQSWGLATSVSLPGGGSLGVYQPLHASPKPARKPAKKAAKRKPVKAATKEAASPRKAPKRTTKRTTTKSARGKRR